VCTRNGPFAPSLAASVVTAVAAEWAEAAAATCDMEQVLILDEEVVGKLMAVMRVGMKTEAAKQHAGWIGVSGRRE